MSDTALDAPEVPHATEFDDPRSAQMASAMVEQGVDPYEKVQEDYFAKAPDITTFLPDGISSVTHKQLMEGDRKRYMRMVNRDLKIQKGTGDAVMKLAAGEDRSALLSVAITGWNLLKDGKPFEFNPKNLQVFLDGNIQILEIVERDVRKNNPWLNAEITVEDIDLEIANLQEERQRILDREVGNAASANS